LPLSVECSFRVKLDGHSEQFPANVQKSATCAFVKGGVDERSNLMREPPGQGPLQAPEASLEDIRRAIQSLTEADMVKLQRYADNRIHRIGKSASNRDAHLLLTEAMNSLLEVGRRHWYPDRVDLVGFLIGAMRSISSNWARKAVEGGVLEISETDQIRISDAGEEQSALAKTPSPSLDPEQQLIQQECQTEDQLIEEIANLFKDRYLASLILDGWKAGMKGPEIIEALNIDATEYRTEVRLVRRRIATRWPKGMPHVQ
jgi:hypothetical protein